MSIKGNIALVTDSCIDLPLSYRQYPFVRIVPLNITFPDGSTIQDGVDITPEEFYHRMGRQNDLPVTSQPSPEQFLNVYNELLAEYDNVISIHLSQLLSGTFNSATLAIQMLAEQDQQRVHLIDTKMVSLIQGLIYLAAVEAIENGKTLPEVIAVIENEMNSISCVFTPKTLENLKKGGRISNLSAWLGGFLQIKPVMEIGNKTNGSLTAVAKVRGRNKAISQMIEIIKERANDINNQRIGLMHSFVDNQEELERIIDLVKVELNPKELIISLIGATVGTHLGEDGLGITFYDR